MYEYLLGDLVPALFPLRLFFLVLYGIFYAGVFVQFLTEHPQPEIVSFQNILYFLNAFSSHVAYPYQVLSGPLAQIPDGLDVELTEYPLDTGFIFAPELKCLYTLANVYLSIL